MPERVTPIRPVETDEGYYTAYAREIQVMQTDRPIRYFFYGLVTGLAGGILYLVGGYVDATLVQGAARAANGAATAADDVLNDLDWAAPLQVVGLAAMFAGPAVFWLMSLLRWGKERTPDSVHERD